MLRISGKVLGRHLEKMMTLTSAPPISTKQECSTCNSHIPHANKIVCFVVPGVSVRPDTNMVSEEELLILTFTHHSKSPTNCQRIAVV